MKKGRSVMRLRRVTRNRPSRIRNAGGVPKLDRRGRGVKLASDVTDRPGGRAGARERAEGSG